MATLLDMLPRLPPVNLPDVFSANAEVIGDALLRGTLVKAFSYLLHGTLRELGIRLRASTRRVRAPSLISVPGIVGMASEVHVVSVHARANVAAVANYQSGRDRAEPLLPRHSVGAKSPTAANIGSAIPVWVTATSPDYTGAFHGYECIPGRGVAP